MHKLKTVAVVFANYVIQYTQTQGDSLHALGWQNLMVAMLDCV